MSHTKVQLTTDGRTIDDLRGLKTKNLKLNIEDLDEDDIDLGD